MQGGRGEQEQGEKEDKEDKDKREPQAKIPDDEHEEEREGGNDDDEEEANYPEAVSIAVVRRLLAPDMPRNRVAFCRVTRKDQGRPRVRSYL